MSVPYTTCHRSPDIWCKVFALCIAGKVVCIHKAARARVNMLVVCVYVEDKWCEDTPLWWAVPLWSPSTYFPFEFHEESDGSPVECESCIAGSSPLSWCRPSQAVYDGWLCHIQPKDLRGLCLWIFLFQSHPRYAGRGSTSGQCMI